MQNTVRIASRESPLAMQQSLWVKEQLEAFYPMLKVVIIGMTTQGDQLLTNSLAKVGGKGLFIKELEQSLLSGHADLAVHSTKDLTVDFPAGLGLAAICEREDARDAIITRLGCSFSDLSPGSRIGTSSLRRQSLLKAWRGDVQIDLLRGNVNTRLQRLEQGDFDAIVLAVAGLKRLNFASRISEIFNPEEFIPAIGQGALAIECRLEDEKLVKMLQVLDHEPTRVCVVAERAINQRLQGGCQVPLAGYATIQEDVLTVRGLVATPDGSTVLKAIAKGPSSHAAALGLEVAQALAEQGAEAILAATKNA